VSEQSPVPARATPTPTRGEAGSATGRLLLGVFASFAQFERDLIAERTTAGLAALRAAGTPLGRPTQVHPAQVELILGAEGKPHRTIAQLTGLSRAQIGRVLRGEIASLNADQPQGDHVLDQKQHRPGQDRMSTTNNDHQG